MTVNKYIYILIYIFTYLPTIYVNNINILYTIKIPKHKIRIHLTRSIKLTNTNAKHLNVSVITLINIQLTYYITLTGHLVFLIFIIYYDKQTSYTVLGWSTD